MADFQFPVLDLTKINVVAERKEKKLPGRPRKVPQKAPDPKTGIISSPSVEDALFDIFYCNPTVFKKALGFFLSLSDMPLHCKFSQDSISLLALDRHKKSKILISIDPKRLNHYYCRPGQVFQFGLSNQYLELLAKKINSNLAHLKWYSVDGRTDETYVDFFAPKYKETHHETLICCGKYQQIDDGGFDDMDYQIRWQWDARWFKTKLSNAKTYGDQLTIKQPGGEYPMMFVYANSNGHAKSEEICEGKDEMSFSSTMKPGEIFSISVQIKYWYPVANSAMLDSNVQISLHKEKPIMTKINLDDGVICIKVLTSINDIRQDTDITFNTPSTATPRSTLRTSAGGHREELPNISEIKFTPYDFDPLSRPQSPTPSQTPSRTASRTASPIHSPRTTSPRILTPLNKRNLRDNYDIPD
jgi:hypothetical protein